MLFSKLYKAINNPLIFFISHYVGKRYSSLFKGNGIAHFFKINTAKEGD